MSITLVPFCLCALTIIRIIREHLHFYTTSIEPSCLCEMTITLTMCIWIIIAHLFLGRHFRKQLILLHIGTQKSWCIRKTVWLELMLHRFPSSKVLKRNCSGQLRITLSLVKLYCEWNYSSELKWFYKSRFKEDNEVKLPHQFLVAVDSWLLGPSYCGPV